VSEPRVLDNRVLDLFIFFLMIVLEIKEKGPAIVTE
jgi:hypothetical protein